MSLQGADSKVFNQLTGNPMDISPWIQSANEKNRALTTLTGEDLIPIYEVIADPIKKQQIKEAVIAHIKRHQLSLQQTAPIFQASDGYYHRYYTSIRVNCKGGYLSRRDRKRIYQTRTGYSTALPVFQRKESPFDIRTGTERRRNNHRVCL